MSQIRRYLWTTLALATVLSLASAAHAATWIVGPCSDDVALTGPDAIQIVLGDTATWPIAAGDTIELCPGTIFFGGNVVYTDNITITKVPKKAKPFVSCQQEPAITSDIGFLVLSQGVTIEDVAVYGCDAGIVDPGPGFAAGGLATISNTLQSLMSPYTMVNATGANLPLIGPLNAEIVPAWQSKTQKVKRKNQSCPAHDVNLCITNDLIEDNGVGLFTNSVTDADIESNQFISNYYAAVVMFDSFSSVVSHNQIIGYQDITPQSFSAAAGILEVDGNQDVINHNVIEDTGIAIDLESQFAGTSLDSVKSNTTEYNGVGIGIDVVDTYFGYVTLQSSLNTVSGNNSRNNLTPGDTFPAFFTADCIDFTLGGRTVGAANTWKQSNHCGTSLTVTGEKLP